MQKLQIFLLAGMLGAAINSTAAAQQKESGAGDAKPGKVVVEVVKLTGTVKAVDHKTRP
jgi:hypothetical protein